MLSKQEIAILLDIDPPFLMLDEVIEVVPGKSIHAVKKIDSQEWFMQCHLKSSPVMPGTLQTELMLQAFALQIYTRANVTFFRHALVSKFETSLFRKIEQKHSGFLLHVKASISYNLRGIFKGNAILLLENELVASAKITLISPSEMPVPAHHFISLPVNSPK